MPMWFNEKSMEELYWAIEDLLYDMEWDVDVKDLENDPEYEFFCDLLDRYDDGERTVKLFNEMREVYAYAS